MRRLLHKLLGLRSVHLLEVDLQNLTGYTKLLVKDVEGFQNYLRSLHDEIQLQARRIDMLERELAKKKAADAGQ